jgi:3-dehydroquinate synthase
MTTLNVDLGEKSYPIYIQNGLLAELPVLLKRLGLTDSCCIITDDNVNRLYGEQVCDSLRRADFHTTIYAVPAGESSKSLAQADLLYTKLLQDRADRNSIIIALGGGVVGDLAGFVAATFMRGVRFVQVPTTLLAQVDSSVGGKVGINHSLGKNLIGAFHQPRLVAIDPQTLRTLPTREIRAGSAEVIKYGFIRDRQFYELVAERLADLFSLSDTALLETVLYKSCAIKADVVSKDEREAGLRAILNFGHTVGHAIEAETGYSHFLHGEAVVHGMKAALYLSSLAGNFPKKDIEEMIKLLDAFQPPPLPEKLTVDGLLHAMQKDKKRSSKGQLWVLLKSVGEAYLTREVPDEHVHEAVDYLLASR